MRRIAMATEWAILPTLILGICGCSEQQIAPPSTVTPLIGETNKALVAGEFDPCTLLSDEATRTLLSGALENHLRVKCGFAQASTSALRQATRTRSATGPLTEALGLGDVLINDPALDQGGTTQSETSVVAHDNVVCAAWNDSGEGFFANGASGFGFSLDGGKTFQDGGAFPNGNDIVNGGDPSLAYSERDNTFYYAALAGGSLALWRSTDGCQSFEVVGFIHEGASDDKELMIVDNSPTSPRFGRIYVGWTDFAVPTDRNVVSFSDDGGLSWSEPAVLPDSGATGQGMWPAVAANGDVYFALLNRGSGIGSTQDQWIYKGVYTQEIPLQADAGIFDAGSPSLDANEEIAWVRMANIGTQQPIPEDVNSSLNCGRQALTGDWRNLSSPQIAITPDANAEAGYVIHATYPYDSDGPGADHSNVFYRRSTDGALSWSDEQQVNDDQTDTDQFFPALAAEAGGMVAISWYDRRLDPENNLEFDRFIAISTNDGLTFEANERLSDQSSQLAQTNPNFDNLATCYHGDYDQMALIDGVAHVVWSDDRRVTGTGPNPDVYYDQTVINAQRGTLSLSPNPIACEAELTVSLRDSDLEGAGTQIVSVISETGDTEILALTETSSLGVFSGSLPVNDNPPANGDGSVSVQDAIQIAVVYQDLENGDGTAELQSASTLVDCQPPVVEEVSVGTLSSTSAVVSVVSSEAFNLVVDAGFTCGEFHLSASGATSATLTNLSDSSQYFFSVTLTDLAGNTVTDDNEGECYTFTTLSRIYFEDFEAGLGDFVFDNDEENGLWHITDACASADFGHSRPTSLYFGSDESCTFDVPGSHQGFATSPVINLENTQSAALEFNYFLDTEGGGSFDQASTAVSVNGGAFEFVDTNFGTIVEAPPPLKFRHRADAVPAPGDALLEGQGQWQRSSIDLTPLLVGLESATIQIQFGFDTVDDISNDFAGYYIDDVQVMGIVSPTACEVDADCDDSLFCNGTEACNAGFCQPGVPFQCDTGDDGVDCTVLQCDEEAQGCINLPVDELCTDGLFCNGLEFCDSTLGCQAGDPDACEDGIDCTENGCSELLKSCISSPSDFLCDDGSFCNGFEVCNAQTGCVLGTPPCDDGILCTDDICDEDSFSCGSIPVDAVCDDGVFCNGDEQCSPTLGCLFGKDPCVGSSCDEASAACSFECIEASNSEHVAAQRADLLFEFVHLAQGSNDFMGISGEELVSLQGGGNFWEVVDACGAAPIVTNIAVQVVGGTAVVQGTAEDPNGDIVSVQLSIQTQFSPVIAIAANGTEQFSAVISELPIGLHRIEAVAFDSQGRVSVPVSVTFEVLPPTAPTIDAIEVITGEDGTITIEGSASDSNGNLNVVVVTIRQDGQAVVGLEAFNFQPWSVTPTGLEPGQYTVQARAFDSTGLLGLSEVLSFEVLDAAEQAVCFTATNGEHQTESRARAIFGNVFFFANGSNDFLGVNALAVTSLLLTEDSWELVDSCP